LPEERGKLCIAGLLFFRMDITKEPDGLLSLHKLSRNFHPDKSLKFLTRLHVHLLDIIALAKLERNYVLMSESIFF